MRLPLGGGAAAALVLAAVVVTRCHDVSGGTALGTAPSPPLPRADLTVDVGAGVTMDFVLVAPGSFTMGAADAFPDTTPLHRVSIASPFFVGRFPVTQEQWFAVMGTNPSRHRGARNPVDNVSWEDCRRFLARLNSATTGARFVLPSESQWEYACRAGSTAAWCFGDDEERLGEYAWYVSNAGHTTHPVGGKRPNAFGLYDMHGNVWEWCEDVWHDDYDGAPADGSAWSGDAGSPHVRRGGSWYDSAWLARSSYRRGFRADYRSENLGFRIARPAGR
jgi:formylglycine-generating enzyme required for sulfatase activity